MSVRGLCAGYAGHEVLHGIDLDVASGEWLALVGPNGSGKSTLLDCASGRLHATAGQVRIAGVRLDTEPVAAKRRLGYAMAADRLPELLTGRQCLQIHATAKRLNDIAPELLTLAAELRLRALLDEPVGVYSYGTRQKLAILLALVGEPLLIVLDEAFNGLDSASALVLKGHLRARVEANRCGILFATHALDIVERCADRMALLDEGAVIGHWERDALDTLRIAGAQGLESALAGAIRNAQARDTTS